MAVKYGQYRDVEETYLMDEFHDKADTLERFLKDLAVDPSMNTRENARSVLWDFKQVAGIAVMMVKKDYIEKREAFFRLTELCDYMSQVDGKTYERHSKQGFEVLENVLQKEGYDL